MDMGEGWQRWDRPQMPEYCAICGEDVTGKGAMWYGEFLLCDPCGGWATRRAAEVEFQEG